MLEVSYGRPQPDFQRVCQSVATPLVHLILDANFLKNPLAISRLLVLSLRKSA